MKKKIQGVAFGATLIFGLALSFTPIDAYANHNEDECEATVSCKDPETYGSGAFRARICSKTDCAWDDYNTVATSGTCVIQN